MTKRERTRQLKAERRERGRIQKVKNRERKAQERKCFWTWPFGHRYRRRGGGCINCCHHPTGWFDYNVSNRPLGR